MSAQTTAALQEVNALPGVVWARTFSATSRHLVKRGTHSRTMCGHRVSLTTWTTDKGRSIHSDWMIRNLPTCQGCLRSYAKRGIEAVETVDCVWADALAEDAERFPAPEGSTPDTAAPSVPVAAQLTKAAKSPIGTATLVHQACIGPRRELPILVVCEFEGDASRVWVKFLTKTGVPGTAFRKGAYRLVDRADLIDVVESPRAPVPRCDQGIR